MFGMSVINMYTSKPTQFHLQVQKRILNPLKFL